MSNKYIIRIDTGAEWHARDNRDLRMFDKLVQSGKFIWNDQQMEVAPHTAVKIIEADRQALVKEREDFEKEKAAWYESRNKEELIIEQPKKRNYERKAK